MKTPEDEAFEEIERIQRTRTKWVPVQQPAEPPKYSFKVHWEKDRRIGVVAAVVRPDGGIHLLQETIDPPQREWVGLTDDEINEIYTSVEVEVNEHWNKGGTTKMFPLTLYKAIEAKLKEKNNA
jgi:hypothetical protein